MESHAAAVATHANKAINTRQNEQTYLGLALFLFGLVASRCIVGNASRRSGGGGCRRRPLVGWWLGNGLLLPVVVGIAVVVDGVHVFTGFQFVVFHLASRASQTNASRRILVSKWITVLLVLKLGNTNSRQFLSLALDVVCL